MFEDRTYNNIMAEMMANKPDGINTQEGSLVYVGCSKMALKLEECYMGMEYVYNNLNPLKMDEEHLILSANERKVEIKSATNAILKAVFHQEIPLSSRFFLNDLNYIVTEKISDFVYKIECETAGRIGNSYFGKLSPISFIENWQGGEIVSIIIPAEDEPDLEELREAVVGSYDMKNFAGNKADYKRILDAIQGVGGAKVKRRDNATGFIDVTVISSEYQELSAEAIKTIQDLIDPEYSHGEGQGMAAIGHCVIVHSVEAVKINIDMKIEFLDGIVYDDVKNQVEVALDLYFLNLSKQWEQQNNLIVRSYQIATALSNIENIIDITQIRINGESENLILSESQFPERGEIYVI